MTIHIRNQKPAVLLDDPFSVLPAIQPTESADVFRDKLQEHIHARYVEPMFHPINPANPVRIEDVSGTNTQDISPDMLMQSINHLWTSDTLDVQLQDQMAEIYRQGIQYHAQNDWYFEQQLGIEALTRMKLPVPSHKSNRIVRYSANVDVIPAAKQLLAQNDAISAINWFGNMAAFTHERPFNNYLLVTVQTSDVFDDFKQQLKNLVTTWQTNHIVSKEVNKSIADLDKISLASDLSTGLFLPNGGLSQSDDEFDELSFSRILMYALSQYEKNGAQGALTVQPGNLEQVYLPENIIILNLENYAHAKASDIKNDWDTFEKALNTKKALRFITNKKLVTAKAVNRSTQMGQKSSSAANAKTAGMRSKNKAFSGKPVAAKDTLYMMARVAQRQITDHMTKNTYKTTKMSYMRANRRRPDDMNMPGKLTTVKYRPDVHVYIDASMSISEKHYRDGVTNAIILAKKIGCDLYITSFSHIVSQTSLLQTKDRSIRDIYQSFLKIPKVAGGTDFEQVWKKIDLIQEHNERNNQSHQINFVITDFGYNLSRGFQWSPKQASLKHTYYVPISADKHTWNSLLRYAREFQKQMVKAGDHRIRQRMLL